MTFDDFRLHPCRDQMKDVQVNHYGYVVFEEPCAARYKRPDGTEERRLRITVRSTSAPANTIILGYLPLPCRYLNHWKQLCYNIVYHKCLHAALKVLEQEPGYPHARSSARSASAVLKYNIYCRGKIIEEIFSLQGMEFNTLRTFDEYIIKERWDLHWVDPADMVSGTTPGVEFLGRSPFDVDVEEALGNIFVSIVSFAISLLSFVVLKQHERIPKMSAPKTWSWSSYTMMHFDMLKYTRANQKLFCKYGLKPDYVHSNKSTNIHGWEDNKFTWLTAAQDEKFAYPGPAFGHRSENFHFSCNHNLKYLPCFFFVLVGRPSTVFDTYLRTGELPASETQMPSGEYI
jgi:hypothetical protein